MIFKCLEISNFKSFAGRHVFNLEDFRPGLMFLTGQNVLEPELGANGVGKSTLWDALHWVCYGKTLDGLKAEDIHSWVQRKPRPHLNNDDFDGEGEAITPRPDDKRQPRLILGAAWGLLRLTLRGRETRIFRSWKPNSLEIAEENSEFHPITQEDLDTRLGLSPESFQQSIIIGQNAKMFFDLRPAEKLAQFTELMDLDFWLGRSKIAGEHLDALKKAYSKVEQKVVGLTATIQEAKRGLEAEQDAARAFAASAKQKLERIEVERARQTKILEGLETKIIEQQKTLVKVQVQGKELWTEVEPLQKQVEERRKELSTLRSSLAAADATRVGYEKQLDRINKLEGQCPVCGQEVTRGHLVVERKRLDDAIAVENKKIALTRERISTTEKVHDKTVNALRKIEAGCNQNETQIRLVEREIQALRETRETCKSTILNLKEQVQELREEKRPHRQRILEYQQRIGHMTGQLEGQNKELREIEGLMGVVEYWIKGFKDVRLMVIEETLDTLGVEVNNYLTGLGMENWYIKFDVERETKSGSISRGLQIFTHSPTSPADRLIPLEAWSGGEGQRLRLACTMGFANLILDQRGIETNLQVWDEPLYGLSGTGRDDMMELLREQAHERGKQIWLIDHRVLEFGFDRTISIWKDKSGSHIKIQ